MKVIQTPMKEQMIQKMIPHETSIPGVYAVGDVRTKLLRQIVTAVADGAMAVHMAEKYMDLTVAMSKPYLPC